MTSVFRKYLNVIRVLVPAGSAAARAVIARAALLGLALAGGVLAPVPALGLGAEACTDRATLMSHLSAEYAEAPVGMGIASNGGVVEILSSRDGASWTIVVTLPDGTACMIAAGQSWESLPPRASLGPPA